MPLYNPASASGAPADATYITQTANGTLTGEQALGALATGLLKNTTTSGVLSIGAAGTDYAGISFANVFTEKQTITPSANAAGILRVNKSNGDRALTVDTDSTRIGIFTEPFASGIDADVREIKWGTPRTGNTTKNANLTMIPYGGASAITVLGAESASSGTSVNFGGGDGAAYAVTQCRFYTAPTITTAFGNLGMILTQGGVKVAFDDFVGAAAQLHVIQNNTGATKPVLELEQLDVSEELIQFDGTVATGNPIEAVGAKTLTTTHFIRVSVNGSFLYMPVGTIA